MGVEQSTVRPLKRHRRSGTVADVLRDVARREACRTAAGITLVQAHRKAYPAVLRWLETLGRTPQERNTSNRIGADSQVPRVTLLRTPPPAVDGYAQRDWGLTHRTLHDLMRAARVYHANGAGHRHLLSFKSGAAASGPIGLWQATPTICGAVGAPR